MLLRVNHLPLGAVSKFWADFLSATLWPPKSLSLKLIKRLSQILERKKYYIFIKYCPFPNEFTS